MRNPAGMDYAVLIYSRAGVIPYGIPDKSPD
jgi:hypothetical protein